MADINFQMEQRNTANTGWDDIFPKTKLINVYADHKVFKSGKDVNGVFTTIEYKRSTNNSLAVRSLLTGGTSPKYTTRTITYYGPDGLTVLKTITKALSYDVDGALISEA